jgi:anhydro-N-acetylmuramic acid kinase
MELVMKKGLVIAMVNGVTGKKIRRVIGLMSGTSVDGIDAALVEIEGDPYEGRLRLIEFENKPFPEQVRSEIFQLFDPAKATIDRVGYMNVLLGELYAQAAISVVKKAGLQMSDIDTIGSHGQTIYHHPQKMQKDGYSLGYTVQIGEGAVIANRTGVPCVSDFRVADVAVNGQGAPLVPFTEFLLYRRTNKTILLQNIGGIGNITVLPSDCSLEQVYAFDTGPGNMIIDGLVSRFTNQSKAMDEGGAIAAKGKVCNGLLRQLCNHEYFEKKPPKSTGRELFGDAFIDELYRQIMAEGISFEDAIATVTDFTAWCIEDSYRRYILPKHPADELIIGGGGSYNRTMVSMISSRVNALGVHTFIQEDMGFSSDAKEAIAFALLADCTMAGKRNNVPYVTGADRPVIMGKISLC